MLRAWLRLLPLGLGGGWEGVTGGVELVRVEPGKTVTPGGRLQTRRDISRGATFTFDQIGCVTSGHAKGLGDFAYVHVHANNDFKIWNRSQAHAC